MHLQLASSSLPLADARSTDSRLRSKEDSVFAVAAKEATIKPKSSRSRLPAEQTVKDIRRKTRRDFPDEDRIRIVLDGLLRDDSIFELRREESIAQGLYCTRSKEFMEVGNAGLPATLPCRHDRRGARPAPRSSRFEGMRSRFNPGKPVAQKSMTADEISRAGKTQDHRDRRAAAPARQAHARPLGIARRTFTAGITVISKVGLGTGRSPSRAERNRVEDDVQSRSSIWRRRMARPGYLRAKRRALHRREALRRV